MRRTHRVSTGRSASVSVSAFTAVCTTGVVIVPVAVPEGEEEGADVPAGSGALGGAAGPGAFCASCAARTTRALEAPEARAALTFCTATRCPVE
ncbi:hypothetical protein FGW37_17825 [Streptomyces rectiverticillatus]|nr:hypothetical protein FGW37_17825 [Streptomyces rectiverticillatus]